MRFLGVSHFSHFWKYALGFRWGGNFAELESAWMAATAYAVATAGIIFDHEEGRVFTPQQGRELVIKLLAERPRAKAFMEDIARKLSTKP